MTYNHIWGRSKAADEIMGLVCHYPPKKGAKRLILSLKGYFDESYDSHGRSTTFVLAGYLAPAENWAQFAVEWESRLAEAGKEKFKAGKLTSIRTRKEAYGYYEIIEKHAQLAAYCVINITELQEAVDSYPISDEFFNPALIKHNMKNPYLFGMKFLLKALNDTLMGEEPVQLIFDQKTEGRKAAMGYEYLMFTAPKRTISSITFWDDERTMPPLQAADFFSGFLLKSCLAGSNMKSGHPYPWPVGRGIPTMYVLPNRDNYIQELDSLSSPENIQNLFAYEAAQ